MKNNEYNIVNITNEKNNFSAEYTKAQKVEYSFQPENKIPIKDELNDRHTINDNVEENVSKSTKEKEKKKREDAEKIESSTSSSSAASSGASTAAGSSAASAAGASAAAASSGGIAAVVAATTVAVVSVGAIVGINVINPTQEVELATFLTSEITPNSIDFSFSMPSKLLRYEEEGQDGPISEKNVVFTIANGSGFNIEEYLVEYEEYDEEHFIYYGHMGGLTPDTSYALTVSIKEENPETEIPSYRELGRRTFFTESIPVTDDFRFETIEATTTKVYFSFVVSNSALEYNPGQGVLPIVNATITSNYGYEDTISIEQLTEYDKLSMIGSGNFTGLTPLTTYTITISAELESGYKSFGYTPVTTEKAVTFDTVEPTYNSVNFSFIVDNEAVEYDPALARKPAIQATISDGGSFYDEMWVEQISTYDDSNLMGSANFTGLSANTEYTITLYVSLEQEFRTLGTTTFTTGAIEIGFEFLSDEFEATYNSIKFVFEINEDQVVFDETASTTTSNVYAEIYLFDSLVDTFNVVSFVESNATRKLKGEGTFEGLSESTAYTIKIYLNEQTNVIGSVIFSTTEFTQRITFNPLNPSDESISFSFEVALADIGYDPTSQELPNVFATIKDADQFYKSLTLTQYEPIDNEHITVYGDFTELVPETTYTIDVYLDNESNLLGSATFTTVEKIRSVEFEEINSGRDYVEFSFIVEKSDIDYDPTRVPAIHYEVRSTDETYYDDSWAESFEEIDDNTVRGTGSFSGLTANIAYELVVSLSTETGVIELGKNSFDTYHEFKFQKKPSADVSDTSTNFTISMKSSYIGFVSQEETPDVINKLSISIVESAGGTPTTHRFSNLSSYGKYVIAPTGTIDGLTPGTTYTVSVYYLPDNENPELLGTEEFTTTGINPEFSWGVIETTPSSASIKFNISKTYLDYDADPAAATNSLSIQVKKDDSLVDILTIASLDPESETSNNLIGTATASNLTPETTYTLTLVRDSQYVGKPITIETDEVVFNGATIPTEVSFYSHEFSITLDFVDDPSSPQYDNLSIQFYSGAYEDPDRYTLGSSITLQSTTNPQTLLLPSMQDGGESYYEFDFDQIGSYDIFADQAGVQTSVYHADITFSDTDDPGVVNGLNSDYLISIDASTGEFILPVQLLYTDDYDKLMSFYVELCPTDGVTPSISAGASKEEDYQNLVYSGNDATSVISYIQNGGADGAEFNVKIYHYNDQSNPLWESSETVNIKVADTNIVYGGTLFSTELSEDNTTVGFSLSYVNPVQTPTNPQIKFVDSSDSSLVYSYDFNFENYPSIDMTNPAMSTGSTINDYASLKAAFEGKTFTVVISYYDGTTTTTKTIQTGVSFTFA